MKIGSVLIMGVATLGDTAGVVVVGGSGEGIGLRSIVAQGLQGAQAPQALPADAAGGARVAGSNGCRTDTASANDSIPAVLAARPAVLMVAFAPATDLQEETEASEGSREAGEERPSETRGAKRAMLIETEALEKRLGEPRLRILDTRSREEYERSHIPGAVRVDVRSWQEIGKRKGGFQDAKAWAERVGELGVRADDPVVVYGTNLSSTARIWWLLKYVGIEHAMLLDGGWTFWVNEKRPVETAVRPVNPTRFVPRFDSGRLAEIDELKEFLREEARDRGGDGAKDSERSERSKLKVVDTRSEDEFTGTDVRGKRGGRIPGATHLEWTELLAEDGRFKTVPELQALFRERGILPSHTAVCY